MKFINFLIFLCSFFFLSSCQKKDPSEILPEYRLIKNFSKRLRQEAGLDLWSYGINIDKPQNYKFKNGVINFSVSYALRKTRQDSISLEEARSLVTSVTENLLKEINSNLEVIQDLDIFPFTNDLVTVTIHFKDENKIDLGSGISGVYLSKGRLKYQRYEIHNYTGHYPAEGKHFIVHEEDYLEALDIVRQNNLLVHF